MKAEISYMPAKPIKAHQLTLKLGRDKEGFLCESSLECEPADPSISDFSLQNCQTIIFCCSKPPNLQHSVKAALGNEHVYLYTVSLLSDSLCIVLIVVCPPATDPLLPEGEHKTAGIFFIVISQSTYKSSRYAVDTQYYLNEVILIYIPSSFNHCSYSWYISQFLICFSVLLQ